MRKKFIFFLLLSAMPPCLLCSQTITLPQFQSEISIARAIFKRSGLEFNFGQTWSGNPENKSMFADNSQLYLTVGYDYYYSPRWKFSGSLAYYSNKEVPELKQTDAPELRAAVQAAYFFKKIPYTLNTRVRLENRNLKNDDGKYETSFRLRMQLRCLYPLNGKVIRKGVVYAIGAEEIMVKTKSAVLGEQFFDRNQLNLGGGYGVNNDLQVEITYVNEYLPRNPSNKVYNSLDLKLSFINPFQQLKKMLFKPNPPDEELAGN